MSGSLEMNPFVEILQPYAAELQSLAYPAELVVGSGCVNEADAVEQPSHFPTHCSTCSASLVIVGQFWAHGRLWSLRFCPDEASHEKCDTGAYLVSAGPEHGLLNGQAVKGNSVWERVAVNVLPSHDDPLRLEHPVLKDFQWLNDNVQDEFDVALASLVGAIVPGTKEAVKQVGRVASRYCPSRIGGAEEPIQVSHHDYNCPECQKRLTFLAQFSNCAGFHYADSGVIYAFACLDHPHHVLAAYDTL